MLTTSAAGAVLDDVLALEHAPTSDFEETYAEVPLPTLTSEVLLVTPVMAEAWLAARHANRSILPKRVEEFAALMRQDAWYLNGEPLIFDVDGLLLDGQHRLSALLQYGRPLPFLLVRGVPLTAQATLGQAIQRSRADILAMHGEGSSKTLAAVMSWIWWYERQLMVTPKRSYAPQDTITVLLRYPGIAASVSWGRSVQRFLPASVAGMLHYLMHQRDAALAKHVFTRLRDGLELTASDPLHTLRERLIEARTRLPRPQPWVMALWCVRTWNALRNGGGPAHLPWEPSVDRFPHVQ